MSSAVDTGKAPGPLKMWDPLATTSIKSLVLIALSITAFGHAPLITEYFCNLWIRPHYQFLVFLPVAAGLLWWRGLKSLREKWPDSTPNILWSDRPLVWIPCVVAALVALAGATWMRSPWLAMLSLLVTSLTLLLLLFGRSGIPAMLPGWLMLCTGISLPGNLDIRLIGKLRTFTTDWSSAVLDYFGVLHRISGNVIDIPGISLFIADACTGIHSLFVLLTAAFFLGLWLHRTVIHIVILMISTIGLVFLENVARVSLITALCQYNHQYSAGWRHSLLGFALFGVSLLLIFSLDSLLCLLIPVNDWTRVWKSMFGRIDVAESRMTLPKSWPLANYLSRVMIPAYAGFLILGVIQLTWVPSRTQQLVQMMKKNPIEMQDFAADTLPLEINGWKRTDFGIVNRVLDDPMGEHSQQWTYEKDGQSAIISLDYPYLRIHDLTLCYEGSGWGIENKRMQGGEAILPFATAQLTQNLHGNGFLAHSLHSQDGHCEVALDEELSLHQLYQKRFEYDRPWFQIQLLVKSSGSIEESGEAEFSSLFLDLRKKLLEQCQISAATEEVARYP